ncbi:MAG TPA: hypothetical protein VKA54_16785, partial [Gemmatimonadaceae bacterium]|nr:hypothetical protein [Gemmatimonadaceae bacterium]
FSRTLALDSTYYLGYAHKIDIYRQAAGQVPGLLLEGDSLRLLDASTLQRADVSDRLKSAQRRAYELAVGDARAWIAAAPSAPAYQSLAILYFTQGHADSAAIVLRESMARPETHGPQTPFQLVYAQSKSDPITALRSLRQALRAPDMRALMGQGSNNLLEYLFGAGAAAAMTGSFADVDSLAAIVARAARPPGALGLKEDPRARLWPLGVRIAAGVPPRTVAPALAASIASLERLPKGSGDFLRAQSVATLYVSYLASRDPRTLALLREWRGQPAMGELDALAALDAHDTTAAREAMKSFPSADSVRASRAPVAIPRWVARAHAYEAVGDLRSAVAAYSVLEPRQISPAGQADPSWPLYARSLLWRGQLQERLGDRAAAIDSYRRFVALWAEADPALQPQRELARASLRRLGVAS